MVSLLVTVAGATLIAVALLVALVLVTVAPLYVTLQMAGSRRFSPARWTVFSVVASLAALAYAYLLHAHSSLPTPVGLLPLALAWAGPGMLWLLEPKQHRIGGRAGRHE